MAICSSVKMIWCNFFVKFFDFFSGFRVDMMDSDVNEFAFAHTLRMSHDVPSDAATDLKKLCDSRDSAGIIDFLGKKNKVEDNALFHYAVLQLTCQNDPESLGNVLDFGGKEKLGVPWKDEEAVLSTDHDCLSRNPITIASQQVHLKTCTCDVKIRFRAS